MDGAAVVSLDCEPHGRLASSRAEGVRLPRLPAIEAWSGSEFEARQGQKIRRRVLLGFKSVYACVSAPEPEAIVRYVSCEWAPPEVVPAAQT